MSDVANSIIVSFAGTPIGKLQDVAVDETATEIDCDSIGDAEKIREIGLKDLPCTLTVWGIPNIAVGAKGDVVVTYNDSLGTVDTLTDYVLSQKNRSGAKDANITTALRFVKSTPPPP